MTCTELYSSFDFVDPAIFDTGGNAGDGRLELSGIVAIGIEVGWQQDGFRRQLGGFHQAHRREDTEGSGFIGGRGDDPSSHVIAEPGEAQGAIGLANRLKDVAPADDDRLSAQFRVMQQLHRGEEGVHVEMGDAAAGNGN